ncbi:protein ABHD8-like [Mercenaria mercenaria]|uniref:protein ABHD8-like n=1 Tax=Mercenaria mercenaria TaxID=6596 RepID=UPI00234F2CE0|nr:protein ABHD8-like [Mercenaria mercenaria]XP_045156266.2 protein ABHD8-like [Mercenaria mercenaria]
MANGVRQSRNSRRIAPEPGSCDSIIEIRPSRHLRVKRLNPKERDEKFEKEMQAYLQYRELGALSSGVAVPPHLLGQRQETNHGNSNKAKSEHQETVAPHEIKEEKNVQNEREKSDYLNLSHGKSQIHSPSRNSLYSQGAQSVSGVHVAVQRPSSEVHALGQIGESNLELEEDVHSSSLHKSARSPRKTKDHRPVSARSFKRGAKSLATSDVNDTLSNLPDIDHTSVTHLDSPFKDATFFFIHGVGGSADIWNAQLEFFASLGLEVIAPDLIGHGLSCSPDFERAYHFNELLNDLELIFDKYCKRQNVVVGHSYGCAFAAALGRRRARRVSKLVLISGGAPIPLAPQPGVFSLPSCMLACLKPCIFSKFERNAFHNTKMSGLSREQAFDLPVYVLSHMMKGQDWLDGDELYHQWLTAPTLLLHGKFDKFVSVEEEQEMEQAIYYSHLVVIDNASHMVMMEAPKKVNQVMYEFIFQDNYEPLETDRPKTRLSSAKSARSVKHRTSKQLA